MPLSLSRAWTVLRFCCGCGPRIASIATGTGEPVPNAGFGHTATSWSSIYVSQDVPATVAAIEKEGGASAIVTKLKTDPHRGITGDAADIDARVAQFGRNVFPEPSIQSWWSIFFESLKDLILIILMVGAAVSMIVGSIEDPSHGWADGLAILVAVVIVASATATNDFDKSLRFASLRAASSTSLEVRVMRGGKEVAIHPREVLVGDIVLFDTGAKLPADGILLRGADIKINESALTGESDEIRKDPARAPVLLSGTLVTSGNGAYVVTAVGIRSLQGSIMKETASEAEETPLQVKLDKLAQRIGMAGITCAILTFIALIIIKATGGASVASYSWGRWSVRAITYAVTIAVVAVPEGLPLAVTISLAYSTKKMIQDKNLVRHLDGCETMGNATDICTDKTGTLTENRMTVVQSWLAGEQLTFATSVAGAKTTNPRDLSPTLRTILGEHLSLNATASLAVSSEAGVLIRDVKGSKTEGAGLMLVDDMGGPSYAAIRAAAMGAQDAATGSDKAATGIRLVKQFAFSSERKMMSTLVQLPDGRLRLFVTGGSDFVLAKCTSIAKTTAAAEPSDGGVAAVTPGLQVTPLDDGGRSTISSGPITEMASQSLRTLALAYRDFPEAATLLARIRAANDEEAAAMAAELEGELTLYGILGIKDPLRKSVPEAVSAARAAGVRVRMVTGDNVITARAIARECGILREGTDDLVMEGPAFRALTPSQLDLILPRLVVLARSSPKDKMILVRRLNGNLPANEAEWKQDHPDSNWNSERDILLPGYLDEWKSVRKMPKGGFYKAVVGVTGDGTNDAPALKASDVGLAMGIAGTEVAKEACDIIITDDNFASIINSIMWGRSVYDNVRGFLQFQLTVNVGALLITFVAAVMQQDPPLNPVMLLWLNLIMDTFGALALATRSPHPKLLKRSPYPANASLLSRKMWRHIFTQGIYQSVVILVLMNYFYSGFGVDLDFLRRTGRYITDGGPVADDLQWYRSTFLFNTFVFMTAWNEFNSRSLDDDFNVIRNLHRDRAFLIIFVISVALQAILVQVGGTFVKCTGLTPLHWLYSILIGATVLPLGIIQRFIPVTEPPTQTAAFFIDAFAQRMAEAARATTVPVAPIKDKEHALSPIGIPPSKESPPGTPTSKSDEPSSPAALLPTAS